MVRFLDNSILFIIISIVLASCDFHVVKNPGPQLSWSIAQAKKNNTFICSYRPSDSTINGVKIEAVFAERKYSSDGGFFSKFDIDCCKSQLVFVSADYLASEGTGFSVDWDIPNFNIYSSKLVYRDYKGVVFPDSIALLAISKKDKHIIQQITLFKVNE